MTKKQVGATVYEKRGDDYYIVNATQYGDIVEIQQYDAIGHRYEAINFFAETAPRLVALIQKAAGIEAEEPEYEYALRMESSVSSKDYVLSKNFPFSASASDLHYWGEKNERQVALGWLEKEFPKSKFRMVKRRKAGPVEMA